LPSAVSAQVWRPNVASCAKRRLPGTFTGVLLIDADES
jgi:hypothetical protein